jgi:hypothetical protein
MPRQKIEFSGEHRNRVKELVDCEKNFDEITELFCDEFFKVSRSSIVKLVKEMGIDKQDGRKGNGSNKIELDKTAIINYKLIHKSNKEIAELLNVDEGTLNNYMEKHNIPNAIEGASDLYFDIENIDLTTLLGEASSTIYNYIQSFTKENVQHNVYVKIEGVDVKVDFYFPKFRKAFICTTIDDAISKAHSERVEVIPVMRWIKNARKCHSHIKLIGYYAVPDVETLMYELDETAKGIVGEVVGK